MRIVELLGTTAADGSKAITSPTLGRPMRLVKVLWKNIDFAAGVDATIKAVGSESAANALGVAVASLDRTLLTLTNADADAWHEISGPDNIVDQQIRLNITSGGDGKKGGAILYLDEIASDSVQLSGDGAGGASEPLVVEYVPPTTFYHGQTNVTTAGTEVALAASQVLVEGIVTVKAKHANTGDIFVGKNPVTLSTGFVLDAGEQITLTVDNIADIFIDSSVNGEGVSYIAS